MYNLFKGIAEENYNNKLTIIDSYSLSSVMLSHVLYAYEEVKKGTEIEKIVNEIEQRKGTDKLYFVPENLNALKNGGRVSPTIAAIANTIGIKPIIVLKDGALEKDKMIKNTKHAFTDFISEFKTTNPISEYDYILINFDGKQTTIEYIFEKANEILGENVLMDGIVPINVCAHCGPGTIGLLVSPKFNGKSIKDYM
jgi:DegV family protein with EDD domain